MRRWLILIGIILVVGVVVGRLGWRSWQGRAVSIAAVGRGRVVAAVYATGRVDSDQRATVCARVAAPLDAVLVGPGQVVASGEVVARQDSAALRLASERLARELEGTRASGAEADDAARRAERLVAVALLAEDEWVRTRERAREMRAQLAASESALALAREQEGWAVLRAPLSGTVSALLHRGGDNLREGDEVLSIVNLDRAYARVAVDERDVGRVRLGQAVRLVFDAYPGQVLQGSVWRVVPAVDRLTKSTDVLVELPAQRPPLQLDLTATVNIVTSVIEDAVVVRRDALDGAGDHRQVLMIDSRRRAVVRALTVGACDEKHCQVLDGLRIGDQVIAPLVAGLKAGDRVLVGE